MDTHHFLTTLALVLCTAGVTTVLFQRLRQPVVLGYILAGLIVGPHVPIPLLADREVVQTLSEVGVILLMFALGLEFNFGKLVRVAPTAGVTAVIQCSIMIWLGYIVGRAFGWTTRESFFTGAVIAISSTTIIAKAFDEQGVRGKLRELVVGILIVEDLIAILLMAVLTAISAGDGLSAGTLARSSGRLAAFLAGLVAVGMLVVPRMIRSIMRLERDETTLVASIGICFASALIAHEFGYSVALGAFIAGSLVAESGQVDVIERLIQPVRDMFAAIFFVSVGMLIDPTLILRHWPAIAVLTVVVIVGMVVSVTVGAFLSGQGTRTAVQAGMSLAQIGEFSFIIAGLGISLGAVREFLYPVAVAVSALTTLSTPWLIRFSGPVAAAIDRKLPRSLQTFVTLYGSWIERFRTAPREMSAGAKVRRQIRLLVLNTALLAGLLIGTLVSLDRIVATIRERFTITDAVAHAVAIAVAIAVATPFGIGILRAARSLGATLAEAALPAARSGKVDLADAPRKAFIVTLQLAIVLLVGLPLLAVTQPFLPGPEGALVLVLLLVILGVVFWRSARNLQGHVRAGTEMIAQVLASEAQEHTSGPGDDVLAQVKPFLPGLGEPQSIQLDATSPAVGKTLAQLGVRGLTGASVLVVARGKEGVIVPTAQEILRARDVLILAGTRQAIEEAKLLLCGRAADARTAPTIPESDLPSGTGREP